ncbi:hypothetical protein DRP07_00330 [Archaeoglobales archaeon]|nr:MAG: hypothetical protein DRP07_00330 [Archaeoglobales archaeon]
MWSTEWSTGNNRRRYRLNLGKIRDCVVYPFFECNLRCRGCFVSKPAGDIGFLRSHPEAFKLHVEPSHLRRLNDWNLKIVTILGGEPFLSEALPDMLRIIKREEITEALEIIRLSNTKTSVYTNSTLIYDKSREELKPVLELIDYLTISIEGDEFWTRKIRGKVWDKCMKALEKARDITNVVLRSSYWNEAYCKCGNQLDYINGGFYCKKCRRFYDDWNEIKFQLGDLLRVIDWANELDIPVEVAPRLGKPPLPTEMAAWFYAALSTKKLADNLLPSYKNFLGLKITCPAGWNRLVLYPDGSLGACQWSYEKIAHIEWDDDLITRAANAWVEKKRLRPECYGCKYADVCYSSCRAAMDYLTCPLRKSKTLESESYNVRIGDEIFHTTKAIAVRNLKLAAKVKPGVC